MSLRMRILVAVVAVLAFGSWAGLALAGWHARQWLREELTSAQQSGRLEASRAFAELPRSEAPTRDLEALVASFDGNRHIQALLVRSDGATLAASTPAPAAAPPGWFASLLREEVAPVHLAAPGGGGLALELRPVYANDMSAVWAEFVDLALVLALATAGGAVIVHGVVGRALRPLASVADVLPRIGAGDYQVRAADAGPPEIAALARGVNEMAARLAAMRARNRALEEQVLTLQDEERADIARDLHDEIGPQLFAANVDAAMAASLIASGQSDAALGQVRAIGASIAQIQRLVRDILARLRPPQLAELGLASAVQDLTAFWSARRPGLSFEADIPQDDEGLTEGLQETLYRIVQESLSNAVRHGAPSQIRIRLELGPREARLEVTNDGVGGAPGAPGYGLKGMAERVAAAGGSLNAGPAPGGGWRVGAELPLTASAREAAA